MPGTMTLRQSLLEMYWGMRRVVTPALRYSQYSYEEVLQQRVSAETRWLDLGCGHQVLPSWRLEQERRLVATCRSIVGLDYDLPSLHAHQTIRHRLKGDMRRLPFRDESFDLVTANMVVEHLDDPDVQFQEVSRILRPGGCFVFHTPNALGHPTLLTRMVPRRARAGLVHLLDGRPPGDVFPAYYRANTRRRIHRLARATGLEVEQFTLLLTDAIFALVPPLALVELVWLRALTSRRLESLRTNIIAVLRKPAGAARETLSSAA